MSYAASFVRPGPGLGAAAVLLACVGLVGCNSNDTGKTTVSGHVSYKGQPLPGGTLRLHYGDGKQKFDIFVRPDGSFQSSDVPTGNTKVTVDNSAFKGQGSGKNASPVPEGANIAKYIPLPQKYQDPKTTPLTWDVQSGTQSKDFELTD